MSLHAQIDRIVEEQGLDRAQVIQLLEAAIAESAKIAWGPDRALEVHFNEDVGAVDIHQTVFVVEQVDPAHAVSQMDLAAAQAMGCELGDELGLQVFYRDENVGEARSMSTHTALPSIELLARGLPFQGPDWMRPLWPFRKRPWAWGVPVALPSLSDALSSLVSFLTRAAPEVLLPHGGGRESIELQKSGAHAAVLTQLYDRFVASPSDVPTLSIWGASLQSLEDGLSQQAMMNRLVELGDVPAGSWAASWVPIFGSPAFGHALCLDLETGDILSWDEDTLERPVQAPSLAAWLGVVALAVESGILSWEQGGLSGSSPDARSHFRQLQGLALPGYPKA
jgi:hypothetical protein